MNAGLINIVEEIGLILFIWLFYYCLNKWFGVKHKKILQLSDYKRGDTIRVIDPVYASFNFPVMTVSWISDKFVHCNDVDSALGESIMPYYFGISQIEKVK